jgi:CO dehydrogenase nickel-insertion accessory protein CooC1
MNEITITVCGEAGTGKTALAAIIHRLLCEHGFESDLEDIDGPISPERLQMCLDVLPKRTCVKVVAKMARRKPKL